MVVLKKLFLYFFEALNLSFKKFFRFSVPSANFNIVLKIIKLCIKNSPILSSTLVLFSISIFWLSSYLINNSSMISDGSKNIIALSNTYPFLIK